TRRDHTVFLRPPSIWEGYRYEYMNIDSDLDLVLLKGDPAALPVLVELLRVNDVKVRRIVARGLGKIGPAAKSSFPELLNVLESTQDSSLFRDVRDALA